MINFEDCNAMNTAFNTGAFVCSGGNVMVASWGFIGTMWGKKVFVAPIRDSRYTKEKIDATGEFTVSVPPAGEMKKEIAFCGSKSGRDYDKWKETGMKQKLQDRTGTRETADTADICPAVWLIRQPGRHARKLSRKMCCFFPCL